MNTSFKLGSVFIVAVGLHVLPAAAQYHIDEQAAKAGMKAEAEGVAKEKADAGQINSACASDAQTSGCSGKVVGKGLLNCMHKYKEANKSFKHSPECEAALNKHRHDRQVSK